MAKLVVVEWLDIVRSVGAWDSSEPHEFQPTKCETTGWLDVDEPDRVVIHSARGMDDNADGCATGGTCVFPRGCVISVRVVEESDG